MVVFFFGGGLERSGRVQVFGVRLYREAVGSRAFVGPLGIFHRESSRN